MQTWTSEMWQAAFIGALVGCVAAYLLLRFTKDSVKKQVKTEAELQQVKSELSNQKQQLEKHFSESADLLKTLAQDYQKLYHHLAASSNQLLPELAEKTLFTNTLITDEAVQNTLENTAPKETAESIDTEGENLPPNESEKLKEDVPPRDYSEGSSGILKAER